METASFSLTDSSSLAIPTPRPRILGEPIRNHYTYHKRLGNSKSLVTLFGITNTEYFVLNLRQFSIKFEHYVSQYDKPSILHSARYSQSDTSRLAFIKEKIN
jgi:hypothetical protein